MASSRKVLDRMEGRVAELTRDFPKYLGVFETAQLFTGPSWYFHYKALAKRHPRTIPDLLYDDEFFDLLYGTLTAWGLHRMGPGNTKLREIDEIRRSFQQQAHQLGKLAGLRITSVAVKDAPSVARAVWSVLTRLRVSIAEVQIVANSKALHHVLPDLVPPIDREYTLNFFYDRNMLSIREADAFVEIYVLFHRIATANASEIMTRVGRQWHTSETKVVDNAIIGYMLENRALRLSSG